MRAVSVMACLLFIGCAEPPPNDGARMAVPPAPPAPTGFSLPWEILDCRFMYAQARADASAVGQHIPEGFTLVEPAQVAFETNICTGGTGIDDALVHPMTYTSVWAAVVPPAGWGEDGAFHVVNWDVMVPDAPRRELMQGFGAPVHNGSVTHTPTVTGFQQAWTLEELGAFSIEVVGAQELPNAGGTFDQWQPGTRDLTYWKTDWATRSHFQGTGIVSVPADSMYADWFVAPEAVPVTVNHGTWDYTRGNIVYPAPSTTTPATP